MEQRTTVLRRRGIGGQFWSVDIKRRANPAVTQELFQLFILASGDELLHLSDIRVDEHTPGKLKLLENIWVT